MTTVSATTAVLASCLFGLANQATAAEGPRPDNPQGATVEVTTETVAPGGTVSFTGTGWSTEADVTTGAVIGGVKLDDTDRLNDEPIVAAKDGTMSGSVTLPDDVAPGSHWLRFLSGADQPGDPARSLHASFTVAAPATVTLASSTIPAGGTISASGANFGADATVTVKLDKSITLGTATADSAGAFTSTSLTVPEDSTSGAHTLYFLAPGGISVRVPITVSAAAEPDPDTPPDTGKAQQYKIGATLQGPGGSYEVAVDQPLGKAFVASPKGGENGSIAVVDLATRKVSNTWPLSAAAYGIAVNTATHLIYTADTRANQVSVYDAKTGELRATIADVQGPHGLEVDSRHNLIYVTEVGKNRVDVIDGATNTLTTSVTAGETPVQVVVDGPHDSYWVAYTGDNTVREFDRVSNKLKATVETADGPQNMALDESSGDLLVDNFGAASVQVIDTATASITATIPVADSPIGISVDPSTDSYFVTHLMSDSPEGTSVVTVIDGATRTVAQQLTVPGVALGVGTNPGDHATYVTNRDGRQLSVIVPVGEEPGNGSADGPRQGSVVISTTVPDTGGLAMSVASKAVALTQAQPNAELSALVATGTLPTVTVADMRATDPGWSASGVVTDFSSGRSQVSGSWLGWEPEVLSAATDQNVSAGPRVRPAESGGLADGAVLAAAPAGAGTGTATFNAELTLNLPTDTDPGTYAATLTLTVI